ncbi:MULTISPECIES: zeta toxin family protein [Shewanella]|uniref:zeta toxin family protein n=1 Tax=Shewanella TaxID=22 RepID=UPI00046AC87E|nr:MULTISPECIES: zeta toxin family protein [Shewanella]MBO2658139.1 zeta toxin family protein [Shewanella algae]NJI87203.1 zeta toxin family protein [Shewanella sp. Iso12]NKZ40841.1 zeta toxin family protein [Shewanella algae]QTE79879.1 zeta toxin family protein [Shewanella algae]
MTLTAEEAEVERRAIAYSKSNRTQICRNLTDKTKYVPEQEPVSVFMCGSPGAGKTESSKQFIKGISGDGEEGVLRLDPDELRELFEEYNGRNSHLFQRAVSFIVERALDYCFKNNQSFLLDGTLAHYGVAEKNVERSLRKGRQVLIIFVLQRPELAWSFVQSREKLEGRKILPEHFVEQFFGSQQVVEQLKAKFKKDVAVDLLIKDNDGKTKVYYSNVASIKPYLPKEYTREEVMEIVGIA